MDAWASRGYVLYLYLIVDIYSRQIVGWEVHDRESSEHTATLMRKAVIFEGCLMRPLALYVNNGSPMKVATIKTTMKKLGITASYSRPRVSNDNLLSEALFRTFKYRPNWPSKSFATKFDAQAWAITPQRWSGKTRNWKPAGPVWLNPENKITSLKLETLHEIGGQLV
ncbi:DDE-type integrase/transposase/recombinase [Planktomarina sp.]|nr:DDE-type integrase/transposase/recombinase [Planktomarina sp.]